MTRDIPRTFEGKSSGNDDILTALWATAPIPRLPRDAPNELKNLTIDIQDPKRVYVLHHANRRHNFQLLVERYIRQLRYGCQSKICNTPTCFTCRRRLAGGAPIRRYNATSARILAIHLASQDDPEQGLCHHPVGEAPIYLKRHTTIPTRKQLSDENKARESGGKRRPSPVRTIPNQFHGKPARVVQASSVFSKQDNNDEQNEASTAKDDHVATRKSRVTFLEEYTLMDHKSFIQNVFGTVAFKMVEWLTPRNLEALTRPDDEQSRSIESPSPQTRSTRPDDLHTLTPDQDAPNDTRSSRNTSSKASSPGFVSVADSPSILEDTGFNHHNMRNTSAERKVASNHPDAIHNGIVAGRGHGPKAFPNGDAHVASSNNRRKTDFSDSHTAKGILNLSTTPRVTDSDNNSMSLRQSLRSKVKPQQQNLSSSPPCLHLPKVETPTAEPRKPSKETTEAVVKPTLPKPHSEVVDEEAAKKRKRKPSSIESQALKPAVSDEKLPQSLSSLPIDVINLICDILQDDHEREQHQLHPERIEEGLKRYPNSESLLKRVPVPSFPQGASKKPWRQFINQSLFSVLSRPESLIKSFSDQNGQPFDSQTIWYCMLRLTRVAPYIVFDSLWIAAGNLFKSPPQLDWAKESDDSNPGFNLPLSNAEAARVINICLHALVAAAPLLHEARQIANMSRIRSYGVAMPGRESAALESTALCLQYDDAFTNELIMRLARRLFAAIPTRRRFAELLELRHDTKGDDIEQDDVLELILQTFKFLDLDAPHLLNFTDSERELHEKRLPTLIVDWARTVLLQDWDGKAEVPADGSFGGALAVIAAIYKNRKSLLLGDIHFLTEYFSDRLDPISMPVEWMSFHANRKTVHLLDHPYLFNPSTLVVYFRAINYSRMNQSYEEAKSTFGLIRATAPDNLMADEIHRFRLHEQLNTATNKFLVLSISRHSVLKDTYDMIWRREERELMRPLKIKLGEDGGEEGVDLGGIQQEYFRLAIAEALDPDYGAFTIDPRTKMTWFQPGSPEPLWKFELVGMILSLAVYNGLTLPVTFPKALYRKLLGESNTELHHISDGWPDLANGLTSLLEWDEKDGSVEDIFCRTYEFTVEQFGQPISREMGASTQWPQFHEISTHVNPTDAPLVTNENRNNYVSDYIHWLTDISIRPQFEAFKRGFFTCVEPRSITLFDTDTLQSVIEGVQDIDIAEMRRYARYTGWSSTHRTVKDFWAVVKKFDMEQKKKLLEFVTASDRVPVGGMKNIRFDLQRNGIDDDHLPSSYTCFGVLLLPEYSSREVLRKKLETALENSRGFGNA